MRALLASVRRLSGDKAKTLVLPILLSCVDSLIHMGMFTCMIVAILDLLNGSFTWNRLWLYSGILGMLFVARCLLFAWNYTQTQFRGADITTSLRLRLGDRIRSLNLGYFNQNSIGKLTSLFTTDISDFEQVLTHSLASFFKVIFFSVLALVFSFAIDWRFALVVCVIIAMCLPLVSLGAQVARRKSGDVKRAMNDVVSRVVEYMQGIKTFRLYNLTGERFERLDHSFKVLRKESIKTELSIMPYSIGFSTITSWIVPLALIASVLFFSDGMEITRVVMLIMVALSISNMMVTLGTLYPEMNFLSKSSENIIALEREAPFTFARTKLKDPHGTIRFNNVTFGYTDRTIVLKGIEFTMKGGSTTALVGPSGSGKSTIISLISRFWDVTDGSITIGGEDIRDISPDGLTECMSVVFQDVYLLNDTIMNNIKVGLPTATYEEVVAAAQAAQCHEFIMAMPQHYETMVGEAGNTLSGGEKQRISIARALIKDAPIVLLDETTSSLDADNEREIGLALDRLMSDKTVVVIAHRLNTIMNADNIIVLDDGKIVAEGSHEELLQQKGWYAAMIDEQQKARAWSA